MSPTYTMTAHLCKQICKSFHDRQTSPEPSSPNGIQAPSWTIRRSPSPDKRTSVDSDRSDSSSASSRYSKTPTDTQWGGLDSINLCPQHNFRVCNDKVFYEDDE
ncbi:hypothetical protein F4801DRAFT_583080 [Xylaria longipes]|nr:hypothetical protein F4801DRAFT_583080 [Xylaria longipes]